MSCKEGAARAKALGQGQAPEAGLAAVAGVGLGRFLTSLSTRTLLVICPSRLPLRLCTPLNAGWQRFLGMRLYLDTTLLSVGLEHTVSF